MLIHRYTIIAYSIKYIWIKLHKTVILSWSNTIITRINGGGLTVTVVFCWKCKKFDNLRSNK